MKAKATLLAGAAFAVWTLGGTSTVLAQGPPRGGGGGGTEVAPTPPPGLPDLGKAADRFQAWKIAKLGGAESFSKYEEEVRAEFQDLIAKIEKATVEDCLAGKEARGFISEALKISEGAVNGGSAVGEQIEALEASVDSAMTDSAKAETLTPRLNKLQWLIAETLVYGSKSSELSNAKVSSINKKLIALEEKEIKAKEDGKLTDLERERLDKGAVKIWELIVKGLKGRDD